MLDIVRVDHCAQIGILWRILLLTLVITVLCVPVYAQTHSDYEFDWTFDVQSDHSAYVGAIVTIHPQGGAWSGDSMSFYDSDHVSDYKAYDYATGNSLGVTVSTSTGTGSQLFTYQVNFPRGESDGYRYKVQFRVSDLVVVTETALSISWGWGGTDNQVPQRVQVKLPVDYVVQSVTSNNQQVDYANSVDQGRVLVSFQGVAPPKRYFEWKLTIIRSMPATVYTTVSWYTTVVSTFTTSTLSNQTPELMAVGSGLGFVLAYAILRRKVGQKPKRVSEMVVCVNCGSENPATDLYCGRCGSAFDATRIYDDRSKTL